MQGTPFVRRSMDRKYNQYVPGNRIVVGERNWDGIDKPDYADKFILTPDEARYVAEELWKNAEEIDGKSTRESVLKGIRQNTDAIAKRAKQEAME